MSATPVTASDVRDMRRVLSQWTLDRYLTVREGQRAKGDLVTLPHDATLEQAMRVLGEKRILSAPIVDTHTGDYHGFFGVSEVLRWLLKGLYPSLLNPELCTAAAMEEFLASAPPNLTNMAQWARSGFLSEHLVRPGEDGDIVYRGFTDTTFLDLISRGLRRSPPGESRFGDFEPSHRIAIYEELPLPEGKMKLVDIVSQSDVVRALLRDKDALGTFPALRTVEELFGRKDVLCVPSDMPTIACFALMHNSDISGVGVVDRASGHLVANLSVSDLRCLRSSDDFDLLGLPVIRFAHARWASELRLSGGEEEAQAKAAQAGPPLPAAPPPPTPGVDAAAAVQQQAQEEGGKPLRPAVVTVALDTSLLAVMETLVHNRLHRVYATERAKPVSVVTLTDVLRLFAVDPNDDPDGWLTW